MRWGGVEGAADGARVTAADGGTASGDESRLGGNGAAEIGVAGTRWAGATNGAAGAGRAVCAAGAAGAAGATDVTGAARADGAACTPTGTPFWP